MVKTILGLMLILVGIVLGLYVGIWWAFIGGIVQVIQQIKAPEISTMTLAIGIAKIFFAAGLGWLVAMLCVIPGFALLWGRGH